MEQQAEVNDFKGQFHDKKDWNVDNCLVSGDKAELQRPIPR